MIQTFENRVMIGIILHGASFIIQILQKLILHKKCWLGYEFVCLFETETAAGPLHLWEIVLIEEAGSPLFCLQFNTLRRHSVFSLSRL